MYHVVSLYAVGGRFPSTDDSHDVDTKSLNYYVRTKVQMYGLPYSPLPSTLVHVCVCKLCTSTVALSERYCYVHTMVSKIG